MCWKAELESLVLACQPQAMQPAQLVSTLIEARSR